jgi:hypothetical protein
MAIGITLVTIVTVILIIYVIGVKFNYYPNKTFEIDLTSKRKMDSNDLIDYYIINFGTQHIESHINKIKDWKNEKIASYQKNVSRIKKFEARCLKNQNKAFRFIGYRIQTRYKQVNYQRHPYKIEMISNNLFTNEKFVSDRIAFLREHDYDVTYNQYTKIDQRKALTKQLKDKIKERDNYTCQECGKYMPDGVGLHIDHIVSVSKGGKSIPSNLRVLCSICNGHKGGR